MPGGIALPIDPILVPIGGVTAWLKSYANTPVLPNGWVECNGQTLNDPESVYNGQVIPNLNGDNRFLRGNTTTGETGGSESVALTEDQMPVHSHELYVQGGSEEPDNCLVKTNDDFGPVLATSSSGDGQAHENLPPYYTVVWIMRVK